RRGADGAVGGIEPAAGKDEEIRDERGLPRAPSHQHLGALRTLAPDDERARVARLHRRRARGHAPMPQRPPLRITARFRHAGKVAARRASGEKKDSTPRHEDTKTRRRKTRTRVAPQGRREGSKVLTCARLRARSCFLVSWCFRVLVVNLPSFFSPPPCSNLPEIAAAALAGGEAGGAVAGTLQEWRQALAAFHLERRRQVHVPLPERAHAVGAHAELG